MKQTFEIEWDDSLGENWMNKDNLLLCINAYCENEPCRVTEASREMERVQQVLIEDTLSLLENGHIESAIEALQGKYAYTIKELPYATVTTRSKRGYENLKETP